MKTSIMGIFDRFKRKSPEEKLREKEQLVVLDGKMDDWRDRRPKNYQDHSHCIVCGRAIHWGKKYCSMECKNKYEGVQKMGQGKNKWMMIVMFGVMGVMMLFMFMGGGLGG